MFFGRAFLVKVTVSINSVARVKATSVGSFDRPRVELKFGCAALMCLSRCYHPHFQAALKMEGTALGILAAAAAYEPYEKVSRPSARKTLVPRIPKACE